ncbi:MAG: tetratricopeptide repeat protein [Pseudobdellovibrionaceae bacterium]
MDFSAQLNQIDALLRKGHLDQAQSCLAMLNPELAVDKVYHRHLGGKIHFMRGHYPKARTVFEKIITEFGNQIGPLCDLTFTLMLMGEYSQAKYWLEVVKEFYQKEKEILSPEVSVRTLLFLAKLSFEWMEFHESLSFLEEAIDFFPKSSSLVDGVDSYWIDLALVNKLKISVFLNLKGTEWHDLCGRVLLMTHSHPRFKCEQHHALLLADSRLRGLNQSKIRILNYINEGIVVEDAALGISDLIEMMILDNCFFSERHRYADLFVTYLETPPRDSFDRVLHSILVATEVDESFIWKCTKETSRDNPLTQYRILFVLKHFSKDHFLKQELDSRLSLILLTLSERNRSYLKGRSALKGASAEGQLITLRVLEGNTIQVNGINVLIPKHALYKVLFSHFQNENVLPLNEASSRTWNTEYVTSDYQRLWVAIKRLNKALLPFTYGKNVFSVKKEGIYLCEDFAFIEEDAQETAI